MDATKDVLQGKWHELKGQVRQTFAKLTDDDKKAILCGNSQRFYQLTLS